MTDPPKKGDTPRPASSGAHADDQSTLLNNTTFTWPTPAADYRVVSLLLAMIDFPPVCAATALCGPDLFPDGAPRTVAAHIITGDPAPLDSLRGRARAAASALIAEMERTDGFADSPEMGLHLLRLQADVRFRPLLADQFEWAADAIRAGWPIRRVLDAINNAAEITLGIRPFDPADTSWSLAA